MPFLRLVAVVIAALALPALARAATAADCHIGAYRLADGAVVDIAPSNGDTLRWRRFDGSTGALAKAPDGRWTSSYGWTARPDGKSISFAGCADGDIRFAGVPGHRIRFDVTETTFRSRGVDLAG